MFTSIKKYFSTIRRHFNDKSEEFLLLRPQKRRDLQGLGKPL